LACISINNEYKCQERDELNIINTDREYIQSTLKVDRTRFCRY